MKRLKDYEYFRTANGVLYHGDCLKILPLIKTKIDLIYTDPPYYFLAGGEKGFYNRDKETIMDKLKRTFGHKFKPEDFLKTIIDQQNERNFTTNLYIWTNKQLIPKYLNWAIENKLSFNILTWHKQNCPPLWKNNYVPDTEYCLFFREKGAYFNSTFKDINIYRKWVATTVNTNRGEFDHPTPKPEKVIYNHIKVSTPAGGTVADLYGGSGTTAAVCEKLGLRWILFEKEKKYCEMTKNRINKIKKIKYKNKTIETVQTEMNFNKVGARIKK